MNASFFPQVTIRPMGWGPSRLCFGVTSILVTKDTVAIIGNLSLYDFISVWENLTKISRASLE